MTTSTHGRARGILGATIGCLAVMTLAACGSGATSTTTSSSPSTASSASSSSTGTTYPVTVANCGKLVTVAKEPSRVVGDQAQDAIPLFGIGAGDQVVAIFSHYGTDIPADSIDPAMASAIEALPDLDGDAPTSAYPVFELLLAAKPDFIVQAYPDDAIGGDPKNQKALDATKIPVYTFTANCDDGASFDAYFSDLKNLGVLLNKQDGASALIATQQQQLADIEAKVSGKAAPKTFLLDSIDAKEGTIYTNTGPFTRDSIIKAGGTPVPAPGPDRYSASKESIAAADVEFLLVTHYPESLGIGTDEERADQWFKAFPNSPAAKARAWAAVPYPGGPNAVSVVGKMAAALHPDVVTGP